VSVFYSARVYIRLSRNGRSRDVAIDSDQTYEQVFEAAHATPSGPLPPDIIGRPLWASAKRLREAEEDLR